jgi:hypothetical protein
VTTPGAGQEKLRPGDAVELRSPAEIAATLDGSATLDQLPFMPEMLEFFGRRLHVARRALTVCYLGPGPLRRFPTDNVVTLEDVRCSGAAHDACPKSCTIFWHEAWLRKAAPGSEPIHADSQQVDILRRRLRASSGPRTYFCQASELPMATRTLSRLERVTQFARALRAGNFTALEMARRLATSVFWWTRKKLFGAYPRGGGRPEPAEPLNLQPGEWVRVKSLQNIMETLDESGHHRGLLFSPDMRLWCGQKLRVKTRLDKIIVDGTGKVRNLRDTVLLEGSTCGCSHIGLSTGSCCRAEFSYWREIWLRRCEPAAADAG